MVTVTHTDNSITAKGHANYSNVGTDIVCAAISILMYTLATTGTMETVGEVTTVNSEDKKAVRLILDGLKLVADEFPQHVEVKE